ncbi:hypothetical protein PBNK5_01130 [Pectobacterium brasiliense]
MLVNIVILFDGFLFDLQPESDTPNGIIERNSEKTGRSSRDANTPRNREREVTASYSE